MSHATSLLNLLILLLLNACHSTLETQDSTGEMQLEYAAGSYTPTGKMPLPGHWGTLPSTLGEDGQALGVLLIGADDPDAGQAGILPIAAVQWETGGVFSTCILAVSADTAQCRLAVRDFMALRLSHDAYYRLLDIWLQHELMPTGARWMGWQNEVYAEAEIARSRSRFSGGPQ
jgi:inorganic pyrophosphatase